MQEYKRLRNPYNRLENSTIRLHNFAQKAHNLHKMGLHDFFGVFVISVRFSCRFCAGYNRMIINIIYPAR